MSPIKAVRAEFSLVKLAFLIPIGMNAAGLGKNIGADNRRIGSDPLARKVFDHLTEIVHLGLIDGNFDAQFVFQHHGDFGQRYITGSFTQAVEGSVNRCCTGFDRRHGVGSSKPVIIMRMKIEVLAFKAVAHVSHRSRDIRRAHHAKRIGQHNVTKIHPSQRLDHAVHIVTAVKITV